jgi:hypothetical protein
MIRNIHPWKMAVGFSGVATILCATAIFTPANPSARSGAQSAPASQPSLDYEFFKARVEPIFIKQRPGHSRCYLCHSEQRGGVTAAPAPTYLDALAPGGSFWTEEQSRLNFQRVSKFVVPGKPNSSPLLMFALAPEAGGGGESLVARCGRQFESQDDPDRQTLAAWVRGEKLSTSK